jgi:tRNA A37 threonylcarbamoyladenosine biosynthesis protein TsaE
MSEDLAESIADENAITIIEWGNTVQNILPKTRKIIEIKYIDENTRELNEQ